MLNVFICISTHSHTIWIYTCLYMSLCMYDCDILTTSFLFSPWILGWDRPYRRFHNTYLHISTHTYIHTYIHIHCIYTYTYRNKYRDTGKRHPLLWIWFLFFGIWNSALFVVLLDIFCWKKPHNKSSNKTTN